MNGMDWASIITAIGTIILGYFSYNQYTKNKSTDEKFKMMEEERENDRRVMEERRSRRNDNVMLVFGELWNILYHLKADRVYIVQPHPLGREEMLTVVFEVKRKGVSSIRHEIQKVKISDCANFASILVKSPYVHIQDLESQVKDKFAKAQMARSGCKQFAVKKLSDNQHDWVGSLFCEFTDDSDVEAKEIEDTLRCAATNIQFILPEFKD